MIGPLENNVPSALKEREQWLLWRWRSSPSAKPTKVPYRVDGRRASSTDSGTWTTYREALRSYRAGRFAGVGFAVTEDDSFCGLDLDGCLNPDTGEITPGAMELVRCFDSYTEVTPSGAGLRIWIRAKKPAGRCSKPGLEIYDRGRYFTVSGQKLAGSRTTIEFRQDELEALIPREFPKAPEPARREQRPYSGDPGERLDLREFLSASGVVILGARPDATADLVFSVVCPWAHEHTGGDRSGSRVGQYLDGALWFHCAHAHCSHRSWPEFRAEVCPRPTSRERKVYARRRGVIRVG